MILSPFSQEFLSIALNDSLTTTTFSLVFSKTDDMFEVYATVDMAAEKNKINGNALRNIIHDQAKTFGKIGETTVDLKEFSITNLEGKLDLTLWFRMAKTYFFIRKKVDSFICFLFF
jgi:hypothetical protein